MSVSAAACSGVGSSLTCTTSFTVRDLAAWRRDLKQEAPWAYKDIGPVVSSLLGGGVATPVAELRPLLTVKG
ncbi:hypothetical protein GCM10009736_63300 [Actinomadura bangladeshensis]